MLLRDLRDKKLTNIETNKLAGILDGENENLMIRIFYFPKNKEEQNNKKAFTIDVHELKDQQFDLDLTDSGSDAENQELVLE